MNFNNSITRLPKTIVTEIIDLDDIYNNRRILKAKFNTKSSKMLSYGTMMMIQSQFC